jgi:DNA adenine methylase
VSRVHINDLAPAIYWVWWALLYRSDDFIEFVREVPLSLDEWNRQRATYRGGHEVDPFGYATAVFYLNRTNHSGILNGGVIGGKSQTGPWLIDARFNRDNLVERIRYIAKNRNRIRIYNRDAVDFLVQPPFDPSALVYLDPPYVNAGKALYLNSYTNDDHREVQQTITNSEYTWVVSYDDVPLIRSIYGGIPSRRFSLLHTARTAHRGAEVLYFSHRLRIPRKLLSH